MAARRVRGGEGGADPIAGVLEQQTALALYGSAQDLILGGQS
jgi:hypothetical protein